MSDIQTRYSQPVDIEPLESEHIEDEHSASVLASDNSEFFANSELSNVDMIALTNPLEKSSVQSMAVIATSNSPESTQMVKTAEVAKTETKKSNIPLIAGAGILAYFLFLD